MEDHTTRKADDGEKATPAPGSVLSAVGVPVDSADMPASRPTHPSQPAAGSAPGSTDGQMAEPICGTEALVRPSDAANAVAALDFAHQQIKAFEVAELIAILHAADLWQIDQEAVFEGMERFMTPGHDGTPKIGEFLALEIGPLLGVPAPLALAQIGFALDLRHRHPRMFQKVICGQVRVWRAKKVCQRCACLPLKVVLEVDEKMADVLVLQPFSKAMKMLEEHVIAADQELARKRAEAKRLSRFIHISSIDDGHVSIYGVVNPEDGLMFDFVLRKIAGTLPAGPDPLIGRDLDIRRAKALGILCRHFQNQPCQQGALPVTTSAPPDTRPVSQRSATSNAEHLADSWFWEESSRAGSGDPAIDLGDESFFPQPADESPAPGSSSRSDLTSQQPITSSAPASDAPRAGSGSAEIQRPVPDWRQTLDAIFSTEADEVSDTGISGRSMVGTAETGSQVGHDSRRPADTPPSTRTSSGSGNGSFSLPGRSFGTNEPRVFDVDEPPPEDVEDSCPPDGHGSLDWNADLPVCPRSAEGTTMPVHTLVVHINADDLAPDHISGTGGRDPEQSGPRNRAGHGRRNADPSATDCESDDHPGHGPHLPPLGVARVDGWGPLLTSQLPEFLKDSTVIVRSIVDPGTIQPSDAYQTPNRMRFVIEQRNPVDVFPYGTIAAQHCDMDHTIPFVNGDKGQTHPGNLGPLARKAHRAKTHGDCQLEQPSPGLYIWTTKLGYHYAITAAGTTRIQIPGSIENKAKMPSIAAAESRPSHRSESDTPTADPKSKD